MMITKQQLFILQHAVGMHAPHYEPGRNRFTAGPVHEPDCRSLVALGYMEEVKVRRSPYYDCRVTPAGVTAMVAAAAAEGGANGV